jgi:hypothetical protein
MITRAHTSAAASGPQGGFVSVGSQGPRDTHQRNYNHLLRAHNAAQVPPGVARRAVACTQPQLSVALTIQAHTISCGPAPTLPRHTRMYSRQTNGVWPGLGTHTKTATQRHKGIEAGQTPSTKRGSAGVQPATACVRGVRGACHSAWLQQGHEEMHGGCAVMVGQRCAHTMVRGGRQFAAAAAAAAADCHTERGPGAQAELPVTEGHASTAATQPHKLSCLLPRPLRRLRTSPKISAAMTPPRHRLC